MTLDEHSAQPAPVVADVDEVVALADQAHKPVEGAEAEAEEEAGGAQGEARDAQGEAGRSIGARLERDSIEERVALETWLEQLCAHFHVDRDVMSGLTPTLLKLVADVAHGPSRPAAPLTMFVLGVAAGRSGQPLDKVVPPRIEAVRALLDQEEE